MKAGDLVLVAQPGGRPPRLARLEKHAPYPAANCDGWYVVWHPLPREQWQSQGGWKPAHLLSPVGGE